MINTQKTVLLWLLCIILFGALTVTGCTKKTPTTHPGGTNQGGNQASSGKAAQMGSITSTLSNLHNELKNK